MGGSASNARYDGEEEDEDEQQKEKGGGGAAAAAKNKNPKRNRQRQDSHQRRKQQGEEQNPQSEIKEDDIARQLEWEAMLAAAIERGMPDPEFDEYKGWAHPISWAELVRNAGWDKSEHGLPVYVTLRNFGASQILASTSDESGEQRDKWYAIIVFHVPKTLDDSCGDAASVSTPYGRIKWGIPWKVRSNHVDHVPAVVRGITRPGELSTGDIVVSILKRSGGGQSARSAAPEPKHVVVTLKWLDFLAAGGHSGSAENFALRLFKRDYASYFTTDEDITVTSAAAQRRAGADDQSLLFRAPSVNWNGTARSSPAREQQSWQQQLFPVYSECELHTTAVNAAEPPIRFV